ncbi:MAG: right-handed parallel beta-helix repeat-containing protein [Chloroflexota bacterium]
MSSKLIIKKADKPKLLVLTDLRELFAEFNRTSANSATTDNDDNKVLDYYDALSRIYEYTLNHNGMLVDVRQNAYAADHNYAATVNALGFRDNMGREIDGDLLVKLEAPYKADLKYLAIIGDDAVVPFTRYGNNLAKNFDESNYDIQIPTSIGLAQATGADGNPTVADVGYKNAGDYAEGAIMSDVHFGSFKYVYSDYVVPDLAVGRIFYPTPGDLIDAIDIFEEPVDFRSASSNASAFHLSNEYRTVLVGGVATQVPNILFVDIFDAGYQPVFENHFGAANVHDFTRTDGPLAFSDGNTNIYNGTGNIWQFFAPWTRQTFARAGQNSDVMTIFAHSDHVSILTEQQKRAGGANTSIRATDFQNFNASAYTTPACHSGLSVSYQQTTNHRYYVDSLVLAGLKQHVAYFAPTTYGVSSRETASHHIIMTAQFINALYDAARTTMGEAYLGAFAGYRAAATGWAQYVPYGMAFYGLPTQPIERGAARSTIQMTQFPMIGPAPARVQESTPFTLTETLTLTHFSVSYDANGLARFDVPQQGTVTAEDFGPVVPVIYRTYPLPMAAEAVTVTILDSQSHLYPIPVDLQTSTPVILSYGPLTGVFTSTSPYPLSVLSSREITDLGAKNLAISFIPLQYDPNTRLVTLYDSIEYQITYQAPTATTIENLSINAGTPFDVGNPVIPVSLTITSTANITGTLVWAVENGDRFTQNSGFSEIVLVPGKTQINWNLDTAGWEPGRKHMWVALQNENGEVIASGWDDFTANGEVLTVGTPTSLYSSQNTQAEIRASVRDATGVGQPGRASDLHLWVNGIVSSSAWNEGADGVYTTTIPLGGLTGGAMFTVTLDTSVYLNHLLAPVAVELGQVGAFQIDTEIPTSTVTISSTGASNFVMVFADYMDDIGISEIAIEYQVDGGDWQIWQTFNPSYKATILVDFGPDFPTSIDLFQHRYCFRSQAIDSVGNVEPIHSEPDACTPIPGFRIYLPLVMQNYSPPPPPPLGTRYIKRYGSDASDCTDPANPCGSIQYAIDQAAEGNEIRIAGYTDAYTGGDSEGDTRWTYWATSYRPAPIGYDGPENIMQAVYIDKSVTLRGGYSTDFQDWDPDTYKTVLIPGLNGFVGRVVYITPHAAPTLEHLHIIEGDATNLGGFYNLFVDYESAGAGIFADGEFSTTVPVTISNCTVAYNRSSTTYNADGGGITIQHRDQAVLKDNIVHHNTAYQGGGQAYGWGGGVLINDSDNVLIDGNTIYSNTAVTGYGRGSGGGIRFYDANGAVLTNNHIYGNIANEAGGGLHARFSDNLTFKDNVFEGNLAGTNRYATGGGIDLWYVNGLTISGNEFDSNVASISVDDHGLGGGIYLSEVTNGIVSNNTIHNNTGNNVFLGSAGGIGLWVAENIVIRENDIQGNVATLNPNPDTNSVGGGIRISLNSTDIKLINNNIVKNAASGGGGGIFMVGYVDNNSTVTLLHNTISNNTSPSAIQGAERDSGVLPLLQLAADPDSSGYAELAFIIEQNDANQTLGKAAVEDQGVLIPYGVVLNGVNNIISGHDMGIAATYPTSSTLSLDYTLWWANTTDLATGIPHTNDRFGDPLFTTDYHLQVGSPAIDQGRDAGIATDIDGDARPLGGGFDIGADEFVGGRAKEKWKQISSRLRR